MALILPARVGVEYWIEYIESIFGPAIDDLGSSVADNNFDQIFPAAIRKYSSLHWTPVAVAAYVAKILVKRPGMRVLDIGCGPGKFCLVGAAVTDGFFSGIEQRADLVKAARNAAVQERLDNVHIIHGNVTGLPFSNYDAFYLYNPFEENMFKDQSIDTSVPLSADLYVKYVQYVAAELSAKPLGTFVATYAGSAHEVPSCYNCELSAFGGDLQFWVKARQAVSDEAPFGRLRHCSRRLGRHRRFSNLQKYSLKQRRAVLPI